MLTKAKTKEEIKEVANKLGIDLLLLFGSRASGRFRKDSDFDIAYVANEELSFEERGELYNVISDQVGSDRIDLLDMKKIKPLIFYEIMRNCKVLYAKDMMKFYNLRAYAFNRFQDEVKPLFKMKFERLKAQYLS